MEILAIQAKRTVRDERPYWKITFKESNKPLITWEPPRYREGDTIPADRLVVGADGESWALKTEAGGNPASERDAAIREQTAVKAIVDLYAAGMLDAFEASENYHVKSARVWIDAALMHGPITSGLLAGKAHAPAGGREVEGG